MASFSNDHVRIIRGALKKWKGDPRTKQLAASGLSVIAARPDSPTLSAGQGAGLLDVLGGERGVQAAMVVTSSGGMGLIALNDLKRLIRDATAKRALSADGSPEVFVERHLYFQG